MTTQSVEALGADTLKTAATAAADTLEFEGTVESVVEWPTSGLTQVAAPFAGGQSGVLFLGVADNVANTLLADPNTALAILGNVLTALGIPTDDIAVDPFGPSIDLPSHFVQITGADGSLMAFGLTMTGEPTGAQDFDPVRMQTTDLGVAGNGTGPVGRLRDVDMEVTVELGRTRLPIRELLGLQPGMVVEVDRVAGGPIDVLVNGRLIARGEVVVIDDEFGVRITDIVAVESYTDG